MKTLCTIVLFVLSISIITAQEKQISGIISDQAGMPLPGVNVIKKGMTKGAQSDFDGNYSIMASNGDVLVYSYLGMKSIERTVGASLVINVIMEEDAAVLNEVVITAQGIKREKNALSYSVSTISFGSVSGVATGYSQSNRQTKRQKQKAFQLKIANQLKGKSVGLNETPKTDNSKEIKSNNKLPLYIIDGIPIRKRFNGIAENIDKNEIKKTEIFKNKKAHKIYGNVAKNGCIVISTNEGNYRIENTESYSQLLENKFEHTTFAPLSTFSIDVDRASYSNIRRMINNGEKIPLDAVKIEEMINYFDYEYEQPKNEHPFSIQTELIITPWNASTKLVKIGLQGKTYSNDELPASNLTFLIDVSGSMSAPNKLPLLKSAFKLLVNQLRENDKVSIVVYAGAAGIVLEPTSGNNKEKILNALNNLQSGGSTAGGAGLELAYSIAEKNYKKNGNNRVILATDGDFNVGDSSDNAMKDLIEDKRKSGVYLSVLGFGYGNYKDSKLETLADKGNGNHAYIDNMQEAQKVFGKEFGGTLFTIAKDVKIQVEFNPSKVKAYRLIGYENRMLDNEDFIDDTKDAGELGSGHSVTALYEVIPTGASSPYLKDINDLKYTKTLPNEDYSDELLTVKFRYKKPNAKESIEMIHVLNEEVIKASSDMNFVSAVALFGMQLRKSKFHNDSSLDDLINLAEKGKGIDENGYRAEFIRLIKSYIN